MADSIRGSGPEAYPYDPSLRMDAQRGLDRLRCVADRALAANLFVLFEAAERNSAAATAADREVETRRMAELKASQALAARALEGELGPKPKELADSPLVDERGARVTDERSLREFAFALRQLCRLAG
ncbi:MAG TPA: hypothetical protein VHW01_25750 [Polyangiaceae bacterium]|nr:hypothetical protein [Polyangiaceae bacterium]